MAKMLSMGNSFRDGVWGRNTVAQVSNFAAAIALGVSHTNNCLKSLTSQLLVSSRKIMRRILKITWKFATVSLFYGMIVHISILQAKVLLCRICQQYMNKIRAPHFWILLGLLAVAFALLNLQIVKYVRNKVFSDKQKLKRSKMASYGPAICLTKTTRSGCIYGYM